ncbi:MAG: folylpolyglutamate synthase/dihydrofolate synthase family protein [Alphaproteobacteria bacterium]
MKGGGRAGTRDRGLRDLKTVFAALGQPDQQMPPVVHIAGTNGKGSTVTLLKAMAEAHGLRVHTHTSPHMVDVSERICIAGQPIEHDYAHSLLDRLDKAEERCGAVLGFPHRLMAVACMAFAEHPADICLIETGMGGRLDPTNTLSAKAATIITAIGHDHMHILGDHVVEIAAEKAGIMRDGTPVIIARQPHDEAYKALSRIAARIGAPVRDASPVIMDTGWGIPDLVANLPPLPSPSLIGPHQIANAAGALAALSLVSPVDLKTDAVIHGLTHAFWPGRLHQIASGPLLEKLPEGSELWVDGAHNRDGSEALAAALPALLDGRPLQIITSMGENKDPQDLLGPLAPLTAKLVALDFPHFKTMLPAAAIVQGCAELEIPAVEPAPSLNAACRLLDNCPSLVLVTGSLYLIGEILADHVPAKPDTTPAQPDTAL